MDQRLERLVLLPSINVELRIERQDLTCIQLFSEPNEARIRKIDLLAAIFSNETPNECRRTRNGKRNLKNAFLYVFENRVLRSEEGCSPMSRSVLSQNFCRIDPRRAPRGRPAASPPTMASTTAAPISVAGSRGWRP